MKLDIRRIRKERGFSQEELAEKSGVSRPTISNLENNPDAAFTVTIPQDGSVRSGYCTIINKYAPHPAAACLAREYILSDEGQINLARGFATPIRDVELPEDVKALHLDDAAYGDNVIDVDNDKWTDVCADLITWYQENIIPLIG